MTLTALAAMVVLTACAAKSPAPLPAKTAPAGATAPPTVTTAKLAEEVPADRAALKPEHLAFVAVIPPIGPGAQVPRPLYGARSADRPYLEQLLRGLATAKQVDPKGADAEHRRVEWLEIHLINGRRILVRPAWSCHAEGDGMGCTTVPGKLVIAEGDQRTVVESPDLEAFFGKGRAEAMPAVDRMTIEPGALVAGEQATVKGDGWAGATAYRLTLEGAGRKIPLTEGVTTFGSFSWTGRLPADLPAGEYMLELSLDAGGRIGQPVQVGAGLASASGVGLAQPPAWAPDQGEIAWAQVQFGLPSAEASTPLYPGRPSDLAALTRIEEWLRDGKPVGGEISRPSRDASLLVRLKDGRSLTVRLAHNCVTEKAVDSTRITCSQATGEVLVHPPTGDPVRLRAPELAAWLQDGWRSDAPTAPVVEAKPLSGGGYRVQGNGWPEVEQMQIWLDGEGPSTCCPPSNGTRLAVVPVILGRFDWVGEVPGSGPFSLTVAAEGGGAQGIRVER